MTKSAVCRADVIGWMHGVAAVAMLILACLAAPAASAAGALSAQALDGPPVSHCLAIADARPPFRLAATGNTLSPHDVSITFVGHSTFLIESAAGVTIATDYNGYAGGTIPRVVTMNHAHSSHYTHLPDPAIEHVLRGWATGEGPARYHLQVDDVLIRNVTTDIRAGGQTMEADGNSIFIFEVAGLCIGHLGHLHHRLTDDHYARIGRIDVLMVPVDGSYTMGSEGMLEVARRLRSSIILPMHYFGQISFNRFLADMGREVRVEVNAGPSFVLSLNALPERPKILVLPGY
ncbi:L-ascorbate metabolism protein UlaG (beta-lactamase superfamily) [Breoghania corrubedonensis]|uniref:L-ascorbate metabolism protein UlaG (Beta-lactamase superfamily) n=1 Tax=Breoghania corrubedonensis TaxID=665038 RepID=A0A2T5VFJ8_9HYPH|nr:MBL fold metallo-hydrolase [Breoghania corrubedonensis]PTW62535.1 L-ascorbate metabolism protein UlaG (beta-lactamase superfamily) [Breoghania corrubedonensis]